MGNQKRHPSSDWSSREGIAKAGLETVLAVLHEATGQDFHCYQRATLERRVRRRMAIHGYLSFDDYAQLLSEGSDETVALHRDLLIGVTAFFRQPEAWDELAERVIPQLVEGEGCGSSAEVPALRAWVPGCADGREAYSLAILLAEAVEVSGGERAIQIFATDVDATAIDKARSGQYSEEELDGLSLSRRKRFFFLNNGRYEVIEAIRNRIIFAQQDLTRDPPFSRVHLISCRNLMIYLDQPTQSRIIRTFHFALREKGHLFLGPAESLINQENLFEVVSRKWRVYRKVARAPQRLDLPFRASGRAFPRRLVAPSVRPTLSSLAHRALAERFGPPSVIVDRSGTMLFLHGSLEDYLELPQGEQTGLLVDVAREGLRKLLGQSLGQAVKRNKKIIMRGRIQRGHKALAVKVTVAPLRHPREAEGLLLVTFEPERGHLALRGEHWEPVEDELRSTREELSSAIEQLVYSNEHLKTFSEEVTKANEELQSTNEELETSQEELQSLNSELITVNQRLQEKVVELEQVSRQRQMALDAARMGWWHYDPIAGVASWDDRSREILGLESTTPSKGEIPHRLLHPEDRSGLLAKVEAALNPADPQAFAVRFRIIRPAGETRWIEAHGTASFEGEGEGRRAVSLVGTVADITERTRAERALESEGARLQAVLDSLQVAVWIADSTGTVIQTNKAVERIWGNALVPYDNEQYRQYKGWWADTGETIEAKEWALARAVVKGEISTGEVINIERFDGIRGTILHNAAPVRDKEGKIIGGVAVSQDITDQMRTEEALQETERRFRLALRNAPVSVAVQDRELRYTWAYNQRTAMAEEIIGKFDEDIFTPEETRALSAIKRRVLDEGVEIREQMWLHRPMGRIFLEIYFEPLRDDRGEVTGIGIATVDLTPLKLAEERAQKIRRKLEAALASMTDAVLISDGEGHFIDFNEAFATFHRFKSKEECARTFSEYPDILDAYMADGTPAPVEMWAVPRALRGEKVTSAEYTLRRKDTGEVWVGSYSFAPIRDKDGAIMGSVVVARDVTDQKRAQEALRQSQEDLARGQEVGQIGSWRLDLRTGALMWSDENYRIFGVPRGTAQSYQTFLATVHPEDREYVDRRWTRATLEGEPYDIEHRIVADGQVKWVREKAYLEFDGEGKLVSGFGITHDVTEYKRVEEELRRTVEELARSNRDLEQFAYVASHDLQEPLRMVTAFSGMLKDMFQGKLDPQADQYLAFTIEGALRMHYLVRDLLSYSRVTGQGTDPGPTDAQGALEAALANLRSSIEEGGAKITHDPMPVVMADGPQLTHLFQNLIGNAIKFRREGVVPEVHISARKAERGDSALVSGGGERDKESRQPTNCPLPGLYPIPPNTYLFAVRDNGIGIEEQYGEKVFQIFQRLHTREKYGGTGIGLALCRKIVERHGGRICFESEPGRGTTFYFTLPGA